MSYIMQEAPRTGLCYGRRNGEWVPIMGVVGSGRYAIHRDKNKIADVSMAELKAKIAAGTLLTTDEFQIGDQLIVPWFSPSDGILYTCPFNFGTLQNWTLEDGTTKYGLGLESEYLLPAVDIMFDNKESSNSDSNRKSYGNNRWKFSNIRQWLNARGANWFAAQHAADAEPAKYNAYTGFLDTLPSDFVEALTPVQVSTQTASVDGGGVDVTVDKFFLLSTYEMNLAHSASNYTAVDGVEGTPWDIWKQKNNGNLWTGTSSTNAENAIRVKKNIENNAANSFWLRSVTLYYSHDVWSITSSGGFSYAIATNAFRAAPACVICG